jgi:hypothetical protein
MAITTPVDLYFKLDTDLITGGIVLERNSLRLMAGQRLANDRQALLNGHSGQVVFKPPQGRLLRGYHLLPENCGLNGKGGP